MAIAVPVGNMTNEITIQELLIFLDTHTPDPDPKIANQLHFFTALATKRDEFGNRNISPGDINDFLVKLGRPPISLTEVSLLKYLNSMILLFSVIYGFKFCRL
jgi:hypothetical protein